MTVTRVKIQEMLKEEKAARTSPSIRKEDHVNREKVSENTVRYTLNPDVDPSEAWLSPDAAVAAAVTVSLKIHLETPVSTGHILCFLSGAAECEQAVKELHKKLREVIEASEENQSTPVPSAVVIPLYGTLDAHQQANVFVEVKAVKRLMT